MLEKEELTGKIINTCMEVRLLINFGESSLKWERITKFRKKELC